MTVSLIKRPSPQGTLWVCTDCTMMAVNGEASDDRPSDLPELWSREPATDVTPGLMTSEHGPWCDGDTDGRCGCDTREYVPMACDACGDPYAGTRHAFTYWA